MKAVLTVLVLVVGLAGIWWMGWLEPWLPTRLQQAGQAPATPAPVYVWTDAKGQKHYGDAAPPGGKAVQAELPQLTVVTLPKAAPEKTEPAVRPQTPIDDETSPTSTPSRQLRNPVLERMGLTD